MLPVASQVPVDCSLLPVVRVAAVAVAGLAIVAIEAWLRVPVRPLFEGYAQALQVRVAALFRLLAF